MLFSNLAMAKKRKTRQEKIILQLKRELARRQIKPIVNNQKIEPRQEAILAKPKKNFLKLNKEKKTDASILSYDSSLIKKDLIKTLVLAIFALSLEFVLYLKLR